MKLTFNLRSDLNAFVKKFFARRAAARGMDRARVTRRPKTNANDAWVELKQKGEMVKEAGYLTLEVPEEFMEEATQIRLSLKYW